MCPSSITTNLFSSPLEQQAAEIWKSTLANRPSLTPVEIHSKASRLREIFTAVSDSSLFVSANLIDYLAEHRLPRSINILGTMGCGKTNLAKALAAQLGFEFKDADLFHTAAAKEKMCDQKPLSLEDRRPFLDGVRDYLRKGNTVTTCSALTYSYRAYICGAPESALSLDTIDPGELVPPDSGVMFIYMVKPYEIALNELDYATKHNQRRLDDNTEHYIRVTKENPDLLIDQYDKFKKNKVQPWAAVHLETDHFRMPASIEPLKPPTRYDGARMLHETLQAIGI